MEEIWYSKCSEDHPQSVATAASEQVTLEEVVQTLEKPCVNKTIQTKVQNITLTPMNLTSDKAKVEYKMMAKYVFCLFVKVA